MTKMLEIGIFSLMLACLCETNGVAGSSLLSFFGRQDARQAAVQAAAEQIQSQTGVSVPEAAADLPAELAYKTVFTAAYQMQQRSTGSRSALADCRGQQVNTTQPARQVDVNITSS